MKSAKKNRLVILKILNSGRISEVIMGSIFSRFSKGSKEENPIILEYTSANESSKQSTIIQVPFEDRKRIIGFFSRPKESIEEENWKKIEPEGDTVRLKPGEHLMISLKDFIRIADLEKMIPTLHKLNEIPIFLKFQNSLMSDASFLELSELTNLRGFTYQDRFINLDDSKPIPLSIRAGDSLLNSAFKVQASITGHFCNSIINEVPFSVISDTGLKNITNMTELTTLDLGGCNAVTDQSLANIGKLSNLRSLNLAYCKVTDLGLLYLKNLTNLISLDLGGCDQITDAGLANLSNMSQLKILNLQHCTSITDNGLLYLESLSTLPPSTLRDA